ncbi:permease [Iodobacter sp. BJB302]|nr:permease [Iodobacter sp. BJB302]
MNMSISILFPFVYLMIGVILGRFSFEVKYRASALLTKTVIPFVIVFNIATYQSGVFIIMAGIVIIMLMMLVMIRIVNKDPVKNLCFCYLNIGWLGLPIASSFFGSGAAMVIIAAYIGSSLFGNSVGLGLMAQGENMRARIIKIFKAPPVLALVIGLALSPLSIQIMHYGKPSYEVIKFIMSFLGMVILGVWLAETSFEKADFKNSLLNFFARSSLFFILINLFIQICTYYEVKLVEENILTLYLICLLPPAANIIVLETHYMKSGRSASMIAWGTCISIVAIAIYLALIMTFKINPAHGLFYLA